MRRSQRRARVAPLALVLALSLGLALGSWPGAPATLALAAEQTAGTASADRPPEVSSPRALLVDRATGLVLYERAADERCYPASITKVMTAIVVLENADLDAEVTVEASDFDEVTWDSSVAGLRAGETLTVRDLLACLLVPSGNDAAYVLARYVGGGDWHAFVDMMNDRAAELGCEDTHFANPCGLHDDDHYTTARDIVRIFEAALEYPDFVQISGSATWDLPATSENPARTLETTDYLADPESPVYMGGAVVASKTGSTIEAGKCLVAEGSRDGMDLVCVVLGASQQADADGIEPNFYDVRALLEWGFTAWRTGEVASAGDVLGEAAVELSSDGDEVAVAATGAVTATVPRDTTLDDLTVELSWTEALRAPLSQGQPLGEATVSLDGRELGTVAVAARTAMGLSVPSLVFWWLSDPAHLAVVVAAFVALVVVAGTAHARRARRLSRGARLRAAPGRPSAAPRPGARETGPASPRPRPRAGSRRPHGRHARR